MNPFYYFQHYNTRDERLMLYLTVKMIATNSRRRIYTFINIIIIEFEVINVWKVFLSSVRFVDRPIREALIFTNFRANLRF